ncbi:hypothetical protein AV530_005101 [Patagioenas fasciata monilis]|uniref:Uncharacterized protein n=1 Tax=Patagioenas fasciata monilis TaxID=372326 RepID=A0A1V4K5S2_PATFA|nr:hypothetical protein AV530_005101 [Patagioenas fasciata monilis]
MCKTKRRSFQSIQPLIWRKIHVQFVALISNDSCCCLQTSSAQLRNLLEGTTFQKGPEEGYDKVLQDVTSGRQPASSDQGPSQLQELKTLNL